MVRNNAPANEGSPGQRQEVEASEIPNTTLRANEWNTLFEIQGNSSLKYFPGFGMNGASAGVGYSDLDLTATGSGTGGSGDNVSARLRWAVYNDPERDDLAATGPAFTANDLRSSVGADRTEKTPVPLYTVGTPEDGYLVLEAKPKSTSEGEEAQAANTDLGMAYTKLRA